MNKRYEELKADIHRQLGMGLLSPDEAAAALDALTHRKKKTLSQFFTPKRLVGYARVSRKDQKFGLSLDIQEEQIRQTAKMLEIRFPGIPLAFLIREEGASAWKEDLRARPAGKVMNEKLLPGDLVIFAKGDRAFRNNHDFATTLKNFKNRGIGMYFGDIHMDLSTHMGEMIGTIMIMAATWESSRKSERQNERNLMARKTGGLVNQNTSCFCINTVVDGRKVTKVSPKLVAERWAVYRFAKTRGPNCSVEQACGIVDEVMAERYGRARIRCPHIHSFIESKEDPEGASFWNFKKIKTLEDRMPRQWKSLVNTGFFANPVGPDKEPPSPEIAADAMELLGKLRELTKKLPVRNVPIRGQEGN